jgi:hypothetical protein
MELDSVLWLEYSFVDKSTECDYIFKILLVGDSEVGTEWYDDVNWPKRKDIFDQSMCGLYFLILCSRMSYIRDE